MFGIVDMLQGPSQAAVDSDEEGSGGSREPDAARAQTGKHGQAEGGAFSLWGMAAALAENVKKSTAEITAEITARCGFCPVPFAVAVRML